LRFVLHLLGSIAVALAVGFGLSYYALTDGRFFGALQVGPWAAWAQVGASNPDPYTRAHLARVGALQLGLSEGLQFVAVADSDGRRLDRACRYRIEGTTPIAAFWTLQPTAPDGVSIAREGGPLAFRSSRIARATDGSLVLYVSRTLAPRNWLEITGDGPFSLVLTFYDTSIFAGIGSGVEALPAIVREACA
jgi:hypothetical protein